MAEGIKPNSEPVGGSSGDADRVALSERDTLLVLDLLENPPAPNARLLRAAAQWRLVATTYTRRPRA